MILGKEINVLGKNISLCTIRFIIQVQKGKVEENGTGMTDLYWYSAV